MLIVIIAIAAAALSLYFIGRLFFTFVGIMYSNEVEEVEVDVKEFWWDIFGPIIGVGITNIIAFIFYLSCL